MKPRTVLAGMLVSMLFTAGALAADVSGKWKAEFETPDGQKGQNVFSLKVDGEKVTGTVHSSFSGSEANIEEGQVKGDRVTFAILRNFGGNDVRIKYDGKVAGDEIKFVATADAGFSIEMTAKREKQ